MPSSRNGNPGSTTTVALLVLTLLITLPLANTGFSLETPSKEALCEYIASLYRDLGGFGCLVESPVAEPDVCYTSTNALAELALRHICGRGDLADRVRAFLEKYTTDFYDYYQVLLGKPVDLPFRAVEHVEAGRVGGIRVVHVRATGAVLENYREYANLVALKAIVHATRGEHASALEELGVLREMFNGEGFKDRYYREHGFYEVYKLALAIIASRTAGMGVDAEYYESALVRVKPLATLYKPGFRGFGDLNLETAVLVLLALYGGDFIPVKPGLTRLATLVICALIALVATSLWFLKRSTRRREGV